MMISFRIATTQKRIGEQNSPIVSLDLIMHFPLSNRGYLAKTADGRYMIDTFLLSQNQEKIPENILARIREILGPLIDRQFSEIGEDSIVFFKRLARQFKKNLQPICIEPITIERDTTSSDYLLHLKIKDLS